MTPTMVRDERTTTPARSLEQRMRALADANRTRTFRARAKVEVRDQPTRQESIEKLASMIADPPPRMCTMKVLDLLLAGQKIGRVKANRLIMRLQISPSKTLGGLSPRQRDALLEALDARARA